MATSSVKLLGARQSPFVNRVVMALLMKSINYELVEMNPYLKPELLIKTNPVHKKIPVLLHGDRPICESLIIVQYIDEAWTNGPSILPTDPYDCAIARFWAAFFDDKIREAEGEDAKELVLEKIFEAFVLLEEAFINCSKGKAFFGGDSVGYLDIVVGSFVVYIRVAEMMNGIKILDETKTPRLVGWAERLYSDSSLKDVLMDPQLLLEQLKRFQAMMSEAASD
ncbi:glutathione S-transferase U17-like isoform X2 [Salvia miltiorrhiza]|uniref:glutathione S-transferase U17-like isoform X2 n=1 Tax=Salvia miltiorrhiza TaxID=226208 RepID=UPI0025AB5DE7|nr:glutathione S-transferase U17-like isoform X2 [Salvia miltiorrhiza]